MASPPRGSWFAPLSIDLIIKVIDTSFFHPFIAWIIPLCFRAQNMRWEDTPMFVSIGWAAFVTLFWMASTVNKRVAFGLPRKVDLSDEVIVITGGASGLGLLVAEVYGMRGATVAVLDVNEMENGEASGVTYYKCDVSDKAQVARVAQEVERDLGTPSVLINNAAIVPGTTLLSTPLATIEQSISTNLLAHFYTIHTFLPRMLARPGGGTLVTVSSVIGHLGAPQLSDYAAAKAGVTALHKSITAELAQYPETRDKVRTVLVTPGQLSTPLFMGVQTPNPFLAPLVEPVDVARQIITAIDDGRAAAIATPLYAQWIDFYNVLPRGLQVLARRLAGVDTAMRTYVGRHGAATAAVSSQRGKDMGEKNGQPMM